MQGLVKLVTVHISCSHEMWLCSYLKANVTFGQCLADVYIKWINKYLSYVKPGSFFLSHLDLQSLYVISFNPGKNLCHFRWGYVYRNPSFSENVGEDLEPVFKNYSKWVNAI